jgi:multicomponent Na+:H+ antiporter subunit D
MIAFITSNAILWPVVMPLTGAMLAMLFWSSPVAQRIITAAALAAMLAAALLLLSRILSDGQIAMTFGGWAPPFGISFVADRLGTAMVMVTALLAATVMLFGRADIRRRQERSGFHPLMLGMLGSINGAFLTGDLFNLYVWFEIMLITAMGLLVIDRTRAQLDGTIKYAVLNLFSTLLFLLAIAIVYGVTGTLNMADLSVVLGQTQDNAALALAAALFLVGFGIKAGYFPLFFWLPGSYHTASITVAAIFAGLLTKVGVYATFRIFSLFFEGGEAMRDVMAIMAAGTMLFGVFGAAVQWDVRRILSFHIISQIGYMLLGLAIGTPAALGGAAFYIVHHIIVKANLFLIAGAIYRASGTFDLRKSGGLMASHPMLALLFAIPALSLAGIPPLSGFWAKVMVIDASFRAGAGWLAAIGLFVGLLTIFSMSKIWIEAFWKPAPLGRSKPRPVPAVMLVSIAALGAITVWIGLQPEPLINYALATGESLLDRGTYVRATFAGTTGELP